MSSLTKQEIKRILEHIRKRRDSIWSKEEIQRLIEARQLGCTPKDIVKLNLLPNKTYKQIRHKVYDLGI